MTIEYKNALAEVDCILDNTSKELLTKIPNSILRFIKESKSKEYKFKLDDNLSLSEQSLKKETRSIISLLYRTYLCSPIERKKYIIDDLIELKIQQKEKNI